ncbi:AMP-binding protein [Streptomyces sp. LP05-1]|uniref:AMP-binding protein n=1 Tax=Streptomyces pyxinae TaxID=2970734 RepID=A0ABT2CQV1_9ACTN|nr:AMP-binding protein [Streptomyces sp. LP05-1]MCS0639061.1 AMP-binding protein [Streptomyces sp. LP05-1]
MLEGCVPWPDDLAERYRRAGYWLGRPLGELLAESCAAHADRVALVHGSTRLTYRQVEQEARRLAGGLLGLGVRPLDRVVVQLPNTPEFVVMVFALFLVGAVPVLALPGHRKHEIVHLCAHSGAVAYVVRDEHRGYDYRELAREVTAEVPGVRQVLVAGDAAEFTSLDAVRAGGTEHTGLPRVDPAEPALFLLSGGTTGLPKLIPRTHDDYAYNMRACAEALGVDGTGVYLAVNPVAHNAALGCPGVLGTLLVGGRAVLAGGVRPDEAFELIRREGVTLTTLVPPLVRMWVEAALRAGTELPGLLLQVGSSKFNPSEAERARKALGCRLSQWFGVGEGLLTYTRLTDPDEVVLNTEGRPLADEDEIRIADESGAALPDGREGELLVRGPYTIRGYYRAPGQNAGSFTGNGFFRTGDLAVRRPDGNLVITGRLKDVINRVGDKVPAEEVERALLAHPEVRDAAVVGVADPVLGERCHAFVVVRENGPQAPALKAFLRAGGLATYKIPDRIVLVDALPQTAVGKVDKGALRASVAPR